MQWGIHWICLFFFLFPLINQSIRVDNLDTQYNHGAVLDNAKKHPIVRIDVIKDTLFVSVSEGLIPSTEDTPGVCKIRPTKRESYYQGCLFLDIGTETTCLE